MACTGNAGKKKIDKAGLNSIAAFPINSIEFPIHINSYRSPDKL